MIGTLEQVDLREVWKHEAKNFTTWLFNNLDILSGHIGFQVSAVELEKAVGPFSLDIQAEDKEGRVVIIENQLEQTDHDHLGKVLTYLSNLEAKTAIWISPSPRVEHQKAVEFLNENTPADTAFFLVKVQAFKIGDSSPAPLFSVISGPTPETKAIGKKKKEMAEKDQLRLQFMTELLERSKRKMPLFANVSPQAWGFVLAGAGKTGLAYYYSVVLHKAKVEFYINTATAEQNESYFRALEEKKAEIETAFGAPLEWDFKEGRKTHTIRSWIEIGGLLDQEKWPQIHEEMVDRMVRLEKALKPHIVGL
jgi:hypothetical protein